MIGENLLHWIKPLCFLRFRCARNQTYACAAVLKNFALNLNVAIFLAILMVTTPTRAQEVAAPAPAPAPATAIPAIPAQTQSSFPVLPPSAPCKPEQVHGLWRLNAVFEEPAGVMISDFTAMPFQYLHLSKDTTYRYLKAAERVNGRKVFFDKFIRREGDPLQQYVVHEKGFIYFYNAGNVVDTQACFIVASESGRFLKGSMLLMPPAPTDGKPPSVRLVKLYYNITPKKTAPRKKR